MKPLIITSILILLLLSCNNDPIENEFNSYFQKEELIVLKELTGNFNEFLSQTSGSSNKDAILEFLKKALNGKITADQLLNNIDKSKL